jgi:hypothetical protein
MGWKEIVKDFLSLRASCVLHSDRWELLNVVISIDQIKSGTYLYFMYFPSFCGRSNDLTHWPKKRFGDRPESKTPASMQQRGPRRSPSMLHVRQLAQQPARIQANNWGSTGGSQPFSSQLGNWDITFHPIGCKYYPVTSHKPYPLVQRPGQRWPEVSRWIGKAPRSSGSPASVWTCPLSRMRNWLVN